MCAPARCIISTAAACRSCSIMCWRPAAVPPGFPAVRIDGDPYWDGGLYSNTPVEVVFDDNPRRNSVVFSVQIFPIAGPEPESLLQVMSRQKDIQFASRADSHIPRQEHIHQLRHMVRELVRMMPEAQRETPEVKEIAGYGCGTLMHIIRLNAAPLEHEDYLRDIDFSPEAIRAALASRLCRHRAHAGAQAVGNADRSDDGRRGVRFRRHGRDLEHREGELRRGPAARNHRGPSGDFVDGRETASRRHQSGGPHGSQPQPAERPAPPRDSRGRRAGANRRRESRGAPQTKSAMRAATGPAASPAKAMRSICKAASSS